MQPEELAQLMALARTRVALTGKVHLVIPANVTIHIPFVCSEDDASDRIKKSAIERVEPHAHRTNR